MPDRRYMARETDKFNFNPHISTMWNKPLVSLKVGGFCETPEGPGTVVSIRNATHWEPAWVVVEMEHAGQRRTFPAGQVREPGCPGLNDDGTCPRGYGVTCCHVIG